MQTVEIVLTIPAELARDAADFGLLEPNAILAVLREAVDQRVMELVNAEIKAYRAEKRAQLSQSK